MLENADCNFAEAFSKEDFEIFRKRVVRIILATDMANQKNNLIVLNKIISENGINLDN